LEYGKIPAGMQVCHHCDNPPCVNPRHLFLGTHADNMADRDAKNRQVKGNRHPHSKLKEEDIPLIRGLSKFGFVAGDIGKQFGVCDQTIYDILSRKNWGHIA
jgi:hypothetical protein